MEEYQPRLRALEEAISDIEFQQDSCRPFLKLGEDDATVPGYRALFKSLIAQTGEIEHEYNSYQKALEDHKGKFQSIQQDNEAAVAEEIQRKEEQLVKLDQRLRLLEQSAGELEQENPINIDEIEERVKVEVDEILAKTKEQILGEKEAFADTVSKASSAIQQYSTTLQRTIKATVSDLEDFEIKYHEYMNVPPDSQGEKKNLILSAARAEINEYINDCKIELDGKFRSLRTKFAGEMEAVKKQLDEMETELKSIK